MMGLFVTESTGFCVPTICPLNISNTQTYNLTIFICHNFEESICAYCKDDSCRHFQFMKVKIFLPHLFTNLA